MKNHWVVLVFSFIILQLPIAAQAQWGAQYSFSFSLTDASTGMNTLEDAEYLKSKSKDNYLKIRAKSVQYMVETKMASEIIFTNGVITINYGTLIQRSSLSFYIIRETKDNLDTFKVNFKNLNDGDFSAINWQSTTLKMDFAFGKHLQLFNYETPKYGDNDRDLTCFVQQTCQPNWVITPTGEQYYQKKFQQKLNRTIGILNHQFDSLIAAQFMPHVFKNVFELECENGLYNRAYPQNCTLQQDTTLYALRRTYRFKDSSKDSSFKLVILTTLQGKQAYFESHPFTKGRLSKADFDFIDRKEIIALAKSKFSAFNFELDKDGNPIISLLYMPRPPTSQMPFDEYDIAQIQQKMDTNWRGAFAYQLVSKQEESNYLICRKLMYFYAHRPIFINTTVSCYSLIDE